ncbi:MAG: cytochrome c class [Bryobacterales bacterium]|nr:cytochrome c class [Bryobacterales bacterium]
MNKLRAVALGCAFLCAVPVMGQLDRIPPPSSSNPLTRDVAAIEAGQRRFRQLCSSCHGRDGEGGQGEGQGPNLMNSWEVRRAKDAQLFSAVKNGVKGTLMPAFPLPDQQVWELVGFVRSLNAPANSVSVAGDAAAGEAVFFGKGGCSGCHMIRGRGGYLGPDLSNIGAVRRISELRESIMNPKELPSEGYRPLLLRFSGGRQLKGVAKHYSNWSVQALDENGELHLLRGPAMDNVVFQSKTWMPTDIAQRLTAGEIGNVLAFLSRQSVRPDGEPEPRPRAGGDVR